MTHEFAGKNVVVTGATGALGQVVVKLALKAGATVYLPIRGAKAPSDCSWAKSERVHLSPNTDLGDEQAVSDFYAAIPTLWASIHAAGGFRMAPVLDTSLADLRQQLDINLITAFLCSREAIRHMMDAQEHGRIVNVTARPALSPTAGLCAYAAAKAAVANLTQSLAAEVKEQHILINAVVPSLIDCAHNRKAMPDGEHEKWPKPDDVAHAMLWLASPQNKLTHGVLLPVYGLI